MSNPHLEEGLRLQRSGRLKEAAAAYARALPADDVDSATYHMAGVAAFAIGAFDQAITYFREASALNPDDALNYFNLGSALWRANRPADALEPLWQAVDRKPTLAEAHLMIGHCLMSMDKLLPADAAFNQALMLRPQWPEAQEARAGVLERLGEFDAALALAQQAVAADPDRSQAHRLLGNLLQRDLQFDAAIAHYRRALVLTPDDVSAINNLGFVLGKLGRIAEALPYLRKAYEAKPHDFVIAYGLALPLLALGQFEEGWPLYAARNRLGIADIAERPHAAPLLDRFDVAGKRVLAWTDQGVGEQIMFASLVPDIIDAGATLTLETDPRLTDLFQRSFPAATVIPRTQPPDVRFSAAFDARIGLADTARWLRGSFAAFPQHTGYLRDDAARTQGLRDRYRTARVGKAFVVGIAWQTRPGTKFADRKTLGLEEWTPILRVPGVRFVSLQYEPVPEEIRAVERALGVAISTDPSIDALRDLDGFASQVKAMDLVITTSNSTAHMAGALNVPVWTMVPKGFGGLWHWFLDREDSPWYPSMRLYRQTKPGVWSDVVTHIADDLLRLAEDGSAS